MAHTNNDPILNGSDSRGQVPGDIEARAGLGDASPPEPRTASDTTAASVASDKERAAEPLEGTKKKERGLTAGDAGEYYRLARSLTVFPFQPSRVWPTARGSRKMCAASHVVLAGSDWSANLGIGMHACAHCAWRATLRSCGAPR